MPKITINQRVVNDVRYWVVSRRESGKRKQSFFRSQVAAKAEAARIRDEMATAGATWIDLPAADRNALITAYFKAKEKGLDLMKLIESADARVTVHRCPTIRKVVDEMIEAKRKSGLSQRYLENLNNILTAFIGTRSALLLSQVTIAEVEHFLDSKEIASRSTLRSRLSAMFRFGLRRRYITSNPCDQLEPIKRKLPPPSIFTVEQVQKCLAALAKSEPHPLIPGDEITYRHALPWFILTTACGLRPEEAQALHKNQINFDEGWIKVLVSKVSPRVVYPMPQAMVALKKSMYQGRFPLSPQAKKRAIKFLRKELGLEKWPKDITRHTAASNWLAVTRSAADVAESLGNSERILKKHYKAIVTKEQAEKFWAVFSS